MKKLSQWLLLGSALLVITPNANALSIKEAFENAYRYNPELLAKREELKAADEQVPQAIAGFLPTFSMEYNATRQNEDVRSQAFQTSTHATTFSMRQSLFAGGRDWSSIKSAKEAIMAARAVLQEAEAQVFLQVVYAYGEVLRAKSLLETNTENEKLYGLQLDAIKRRQEAGDSTAKEVSQVEYYLSQAKVSRLDAERLLAQAEAELERVTVQDVDVTEPMLASLDILLPTTIEACINLAKLNNPNVKMAQAEYQWAEHQRDVEKSALYPSLDLQGDIIRQGGLRTNSNTGKSYDNERIMLNLRVPFYQGGRVYSRVRMAENNSDSNYQMWQKAIQQAEKNVKDAWIEIGTAKKVVMQYQDAVTASNRALEGVTRERDMGILSTLDVLEAQRDLFNARLNLADAIKRDFVAPYELLAAMGQLDIQSLGGEVEVYDPEEHYKETRSKLGGF